MSMSDKVLCGQYYAAESVVHALDPRTKLIAALALVVIGFLAKTPMALGACVLATALCYACARIPAGVAVRSVAPLMFIVAITVLLNLFFVHDGTDLWRFGPLCITSVGVRNAIFFGVRLTVFLFIMCLLTLSTTTIDITDATEKLLRPLTVLHVPVHELSMMAGIALRFLPQFARESRSIRQAQESRGSRLPSSRTSGIARFSAVVVPLFTSVFRHADTLAAAMDARCYSGGTGRTRLHPMRFSHRDAAAAIAVVLILAAVLMSNMCA